MPQLLLDFKKEVSLFDDMILNILKDYTADEPIKGSALALSLSISTKTLREHVKRLRRKGFYIGSSTGKKPGYYLFKNKEEFDKTCQHIRRRAMSLLKTESDMKEKTLSELLGQKDFSEWERGNGKT